MELVTTGERGLANHCNGIEVASKKKKSFIGGNHRKQIRDGLVFLRKAVHEMDTELRRLVPDSSIQEEISLFLHSARLHLSEARKSLAG